MERYIKLYQNVIEPSVSDAMIELFNRQDSVQRSSPIMNFTEINLNQNREVWGQYTDYLTYNFKQVLEQYRTELEITTWPEKYAFEEIRMKKYEPDIGKFDQHVDVGDYSSARRFLVFFAYLNNGLGGETSFDTMGINIPRSAGSVLVFPPHWTYPHTGRVCRNDPKYIIGSYLHYV